MYVNVSFLVESQTHWLTHDPSIGSIIDELMVVTNRARCTNRTSIRPGFETVS